MTEKQIIKYLKENKLDIQNANAALFVCDLVYKTYAELELFGVALSPIFCYISYNNLNSFYQFVSGEKIGEIAKKLYFDYLKQPRNLNRTINKHLKLTENIDEVWENYQNKNVKPLIDDDLLKVFDKLVELSGRWWHYGAMLEDKGGIIDAEVIPKFAQRHKLNENAARRIFSILSHPEEQSFFNIARKDFLNLCVYAVKNSDDKNSELLADDKVFQKMITAYFKKYFWIKTDYYKAEKIDAENLINEIFQEIKKSGKNGIARELSGIAGNFNKINKEKISILKKFKLTEADKKDIKFAKLIIYWHDQRKMGMTKQFHYILSIIEEIAKRRNLKYHDLAICTVEEIRRLLSGGKTIKRDEAMGRNEGVFLAYEKGKNTKMFYGAAGNNMFNIAVKTNKEKEIKGTVASQGKNKILKGAIRIVLNPAINIFNDNEILVTSMTRVEFVPLIRRAKAIITDEGGIACHAAIISRELGIPCIIGTKIATKVLQDGDLVEVDAEKGIVKILKKNKTGIA